MESNPGRFGVSGERVSPNPEDTIVRLTLTLGDARRLHSILDKGLPNNQRNSIWGLKERLQNLLESLNVHHKDLG